MRLLVALLVLGASLAGCVGDDPPADPPVPTGDPDDVPPGVDVGGNASDPAPSRTYTFRLSNQTYADSLAQYRIVAQSDLQVRLEWNATMGTYANRDDCAAGSVLYTEAPSGGQDTSSAAPEANGTEPSPANGTGDPGNGTGNGTGDPGQDPPGGDDPPARSQAFMVLWAAQNHVFARATVAGEGYEVRPDDTDASGQIPQGAGFSGDFTVAAGDDIVVSLGGHSTRFANSRYQDPDAQGQFRDNRFEIRLDVTGDASLEALPDAPVRCGVGPYQAEGRTLGVDGQISSASLGGSVSLDTAQASTVLVEHDGGPGDAFQVMFLERTYETQDVRATRPEPGSLAIEFEQTVDEFPALFWFLADAHWPAVAAA